MKTLNRLALLYVLLCSTVLAGDFKFIRIDVPNASLTRANGNNAKGDIVGRFDDANGIHSYLLRNGRFTKLDFPGAASTIARAINARGDIVGRILDANGNDHGFLLRDGHFTQIDFPGSVTTSARGINNAGDITGNYSLTGDDEQGFVLQDGKFQTVNVPNSGTTDVWTAKDNGRLLIGDIFTEADGGIHGYIRSKPGDFRIVDYPRAGAPCSALRWINERDDIVGVYANSLDECYALQAHGFLIRQGRYLAIDFPGAAYTDLFGINDDGEMVGTYTDQQGKQHGFKAIPESR